jgi:hypothetical protein
MLDMPSLKHQGKIQIKILNLYRNTTRFELISLVNSLDAAYITDMANALRSMNDMPAIVRRSFSA